jgi:aryl-phospho-beta-D-glucosidase BglC (GH1 family)
MNRFVYAKGKKIYDKDGQELLLKGVGLGGWMLPEGYMWGSHKYYNRPRRFEELIEYYMEDQASTWWDTYYKTWISDQDFKLIKEHGYNSVRLAINYRLLMEENDKTNQVVFKEYGFKMIDYTIEQSKKHDLYVILDLHGAPGGQTGANIDDSKDDYPHLYENKIYQDQLITLWKEIAKKYKDEETVCMYDLLNEPIPAHFSKLNKYLEPLHERLIHEIREIDPDHMICIEGNNWASDFSTITKKIADNTLLHFHKYWNPPAIEQIQRFLDKRQELDMPLWMGEGGENDLYWYSANFKMYDQLDIGWNFWAYKKRNNHNSLVSFDLPQDWNTILDPQVRIDKNKGKELLNQFLENIKFENCTINKDVSDALFYRDTFFTSGGSYDFLGPNKSFKVTEEYDDSPIRKTDKTHICDKDGNTFEGVWGCHNKEQIQEEIFPYLQSNPGDYYVYSFNVTDTSVSHKITITHKDLDADFYINGQIVEIDSETSDIIIEYTTQKHSNALTIECLNQAIIKKISFE